jgi:hypothetical protein
MAVPQVAEADELSHEAMSECLAPGRGSSALGSIAICGYGTRQMSSTPLVA